MKHKCEAIHYRKGQYIDCKNNAQYKIIDIECEDSEPFLVCQKCLLQFIPRNTDNPHYILLDELGNRKNYGQQLTLGKDFRGIPTTSTICSHVPADTHNQIFPEAITRCIDELFPKGDKRRGDALVLQAVAFLVGKRYGQQVKPFTNGEAKRNWKDQNTNSRFSSVDNPKTADSQQPLNTSLGEIPEVDRNLSGGEYSYKQGAIPNGEGIGSPALLSPADTHIKKKISRFYNDMSKEEIKLRQKVNDIIEKVVIKECDKFKNKWVRKAKFVFDRRKK